MLPEIKLTEDLDITHHSPLLRGMKFAISYGQTEGGIGLTATGAMNRKFVHWAAVHFDWPEYTVEELYSVNKVINELDFPPLGVVRDMIGHFRLMRRQKDRLLPTKNGRDFLAQPRAFFDSIAETYLFRNIEIGETQHDVRERMQVWDHYLNAIDAIADEGFSLERLKQGLGIISVEGHPFDWGCWGLRQMAHGHGANRRSDGHHCGMRVSDFQQTRRSGEVSPGHPAGTGHSDFVPTSEDRIR